MSDAETRAGRARSSIKFVYTESTGQILQPVDVFLAEDLVDPVTVSVLPLIL